MSSRHTVTPETFTPGGDEKLADPQYWTYLMRTVKGIQKPVDIKTYFLI